MAETGETGETGGGRAKKSDGGGGSCEKKQGDVLSAGEVLSAGGGAIGGIDGRTVLVEECQ